MRETYYAHSVKETQQIAETIGKALEPDNIVLLNGEMGAGKTTFTHGLVRGAGSKDHVASPTFALVNVYETPTFDICHFDLYRLSDEEEVEGIGFYDYLDKGNPLIIEWSDLIVDQLPKAHLLTIHLEAVNENTRKITVEKSE